MTTATQDSPGQQRGKLTSWFTKKEWGVLLAAVAIVTVGITAAALTPDDSLASAAASAPAPNHCDKPLSAPTTATTETAPATTAETTKAPLDETSAPKTTTVATASSAKTSSTARKPAKKKAAKPKIAAPKTTEPALVSAGLTVELGSYKGAPLRWLVLDADDDELLLLSADIVTAGAFRSDWESANANRYAGSEVRFWLTDTFAAQAFSEQQRDALLPHSGDGADGDRLFLLTAAEVKRYLPKASEREASASDSEVGYGGEALTVQGGHAQWWLADSATGDTRAQTVRADGSLSNELVYYADLGVRPAIRVDRSKIALTLTPQGGN